MTRPRPRPCRACGKPVIFAAVANKAGNPPGRMPLNPDPDPDGNVAVYRDVTGSLTGRVVGKGGPHLGYERLMMPHFATCEKRAPAPAPDPAPPAGVTDLGQWKRDRARPPRPRRARP